METTSATQPTLGDGVPPRLAAYYAALDDGRPADAAGTFSADVRYAVPAVGATETDPRVETRGRDALATRFEARGGRLWRHHLQLVVVDGTSCLVEGLGIDPGTGEPLSTFAASIQLADDGALRRYLAYVCAPAVTPTPADVSLHTAGGDALDVLDRYFDALDRGDFEEAAGCFSADVFYSHPPYRHTGIDGDRRVEFRGRPALLDAFRARGAQRFDHRIVAGIQRGNACMVEGLVENLPDGDTGSFVSSLSLDGDGLIRRYVSFYCQPGVPRDGGYSSS